MKHTPTPWKCNGTCIDGPEDSFITWITGPDPEVSAANAAFIVLAVNTHPALVSALDPGFMDWILARLIHVHGENQNADYIIKLRELASQQRHALRLARGEDDNTKESE